MRSPEDGVTELALTLSADTVVPLPEHLPEQLLSVYATCRDPVVPELPAAAGKRLVAVTSATGEVGETREFDLTACLHRLEMPTGGYAVLEPP